MSAPATKKASATSSSAGARVTASTPLADWPLFMTVREVAIVRGQSYGYLLDACQKGRMWPPPIADEHGVIKPYRFNKADVYAAATGALPRPRRLLLRPRTTLTRRSA